MNETIIAVYERGVLRPLQPLELPDHACVQVKIIKQPSRIQKERRRVQRALLNAGVIGPRTSVGSIPQVSEAQMDAASRSLAAGGPLSELIIMERNGR